MKNVNLTSLPQQSEKSEIPGEYFRSREILYGFLLILLLVKSVQYLKNNNKKKKCDSLGSSEKDSTYAAFRNLPGPKPFPIRYIGNAFNLIRTTDVLKMMQELAQKYGECLRLTLLGDDYVILNSPQYVQALLMSNDNGHLAKGGLEDLLWPEEVEALVILPSDKWRVRRKMLNRSFTYKALDQYSPCFNRHSDKLVKELENSFCDGKARPIDGIVTSCVFRSTSETLMGVEFTDEESTFFCETLDTLIHLAFHRIHRPWLHANWAWRLHPSARKSAKLMGEMEDMSYKVIRKHLANLTIKKPETCEDQGYDSGTVDALKSSINGNVVEIMLHHGLSELEIFHEVVALLGIGQDTTSLSIVYALFLLASNPHCQSKCRDEIDAVFNNPSKHTNGSLDFHALKDLKYLERCILEAQRIYPLASAMRRLDTPLKLGEDLVIPAGVIVFYIAYILHMNPEYFPNPEKFDPDRHLPEQIKARHPYAFLPFSAGPRNCIGMKLAMVELKIVIAKILHSFEVSTPVRREDIKLVYNGMPRPSKPITFVFKRRTF